MNVKSIKRVRGTVYFWYFSLPLLSLVATLLGLILFIKKNVVLIVHGHVGWFITDWKFFGLFIFLYCLFALFVCYKYFFYSFLTKKEEFILDVDTELKLKKEYRWHCLIFGCVHLLPIIVFFIIQRKLRK